MNVKQLLKPQLLYPQTNYLINAKRTKLSRGQRQFFELKDRDEPEFFSSDEPNPVADIEKKIDASKKKLEWRTPVNTQRTWFTTGLRFFAPERTKKLLEFLSHPFTQETILETFAFKNYQMEAFNQRFISDRHRILGNELAAAHFIVARGGQVK